ncbi:Zinc finger protein ZAT5 [Apostasia shenzhenica]|uniref:Zinc finger protein ZAT5 n=1 Tax=Apostasia shenzhenica TaxID=1088818 RepID=A0A2I0AHF9_9ASPA|nr:Zinc finger protein ZAT5 [Apostasia shenzhenica]
MESQEEALGSNSCSGDSPYPSFTRRKRTVRQRAAPLPPAAAAAATSSLASSAEDSGITDQKDIGTTSSSSPKAATFPRTNSAAPPRGDSLVGGSPSAKPASSASPPSRPSAATEQATRSPKHRPWYWRLSATYKLEPPPPATLAGKDGAGTAKIHECSVCGSKFSSEQTLGGHMREREREILRKDRKFQKNSVPVRLSYSQITQKKARIFD